MMNLAVFCEKLGQEGFCLTLDNVVLRLLQASDEEAVWETYSDAEAMQYRSNEPMTSRHEAKEFIDSALRPDCVRVAIADKSTNKAIGSLVWKVEGDNFMGYSLHKDYWGKGLAYEATQAWLQYLQNISEERFYASVRKANERSIRLIERLGGVCIGGNVQKFLYRFGRI